MSYFKYSDTADPVMALFDEIEKEQNPEARARSIALTMNAISARLTSSLQRACLDLFASGMQTDVIAETFGISQRAVKRLIARQAAQSGIRNPLMKNEVGAYVDIRALVDSGKP